MKKLVEVIEVENEGLLALIGKKVLLFCLNYIYTGVLTGVNESCVLLEKAQIVYETGGFQEKKYTNAENLPYSKWYVQKAAIESFGEDGK